MPVVINEFEVASAPQNQASGPSSPPQGEMPKKKPEEIERMMYRQRERLARVRAY